MKKSYSLFCLTLLLAVYVSSCNSEPKLVFDSNEDGIDIKVWEEKRSFADSKSSSKGEKKITASGDLQFVIKSIYNANDADLDISELSKKNKGYRVEVNSSKERNIQENINQVLVNWLTDSEFEVFYGRKDNGIYTLKVENEALLLSNIYESVDGRTSSLKTTRNEMVLEGPIKQLANALEKQVSSIPIEIMVSDTIDSQMFTITLNRKKGMQGIVEQLASEYGLSLQKETRVRKVLKVK